MKEKYIIQQVIAGPLVPESSLLTSSLIEVGGGTDEFDTQMKGGNDSLSSGRSMPSKHIDLWWLEAIG